MVTAAEETQMAAAGEGGPIIKPPEGQPEEGPAPAGAEEAGTTSKGVHVLSYAKPPARKRVKWVEEEGKEQPEDQPSEELWKFVRQTHAFIAKQAGEASLVKSEAVEDRSNAQRDALHHGDETQSDTESVADEKLRPKKTLPNPQEVIDLIIQAKGDADVLVDMINQLEGSIWLRPQHAMPAGPEAGAKQREAVLKSSTVQLQYFSIAETLKSGAAALQGFVDLDNRFYTDLARLQRNWGVQLTPAYGRKQSIFQADISLASYVLPIDILKNEEGVMHIDVDTEAGSAGAIMRHPGEVMVRQVWGLEQVHAELTRMQQSRWWKDIENAMAEKAQEQADNAAMHIKQLVNLLEGTTPGPEVRAFKPLLEGSMVAALRPRLHSPLDPVPCHQSAASSSSRVAAARSRGNSRARSELGHWQGVRWLWQQQPSPSGLVGRGDGPPLDGIVSWIRHSRARASALTTLRDAAEAAGVPPGTVQVEWVQSWHSCVSVLVAKTQSQHEAKFVVRGEQLELEGVLESPCNLQWARALVQRLPSPDFGLPKFAASLVEVGETQRLGEQDIFGAEQTAQLVDSGFFR